MSCLASQSDLLARQDLTLASHLAASVEDALRAHPDLQVRVDGLDEPMSVAELLDALRAEAAESGIEAKLVEAAARCFISH